MADILLCLCINHRVFHRLLEIAENATSAMMQTGARFTCMPLGGIFYETPVIHNQDNRRFQLIEFRRIYGT